MRYSQAFAGVAREASAPVALALLEAGAWRPPCDGEFAPRITLDVRQIKKLPVDDARALVPYGDAASLDAIWRADKRKGVRLEVCRAAEFPEALLVDAIDWLGTSTKYWETREVAAELMARCSTEQLIALMRKSPGSVFEQPLGIALAKSFSSREEALEFFQSDPEVNRRVFLRALAEAIRGNTDLTGSDIVAIAGDSLATALRWAADSGALDARAIDRLTSDINLAQAAENVRFGWTNEAQTTLVALIDTRREAVVRLAAASEMASVIAKHLTEEDLNWIPACDLVKIVGTLEDSFRGQAADRLATEYEALSDPDDRRVATHFIVHDASESALCGLLDRSPNASVAGQVLAAVRGFARRDDFTVPGGVVQRLMMALPEHGDAFVELVHPGLPAGLVHGLVDRYLQKAERPSRGLDQNLVRVLDTVPVADDQIVDVVVRGGCEARWLTGGFAAKPQSRATVLGVLAAVPTYADWQTIYSALTGDAAWYEDTEITDLVVDRALEAGADPSRLVARVPLNEDQVLRAVRASHVATEALLLGTEANPITAARRQAILAVCDVEGRTLVRSYLACAPDPDERDSVRASLAYTDTEDGPHNRLSTSELIAFMTEFTFTDDEVAALLTSEPNVLRRWAAGELTANRPNVAALQAILASPLAANGRALHLLAPALFEHDFGREHLINSEVYLDASRLAVMAGGPDAELETMRFAWEYFHGEIGDDATTWRFILGAIDEWPGSLASLATVARSLAGTS